MHKTMILLLTTLLLSGCVTDAEFNQLKTDLASGAQPVKVDVLAGLPIGTIILLKQPLIGGSLPPDLAARGWVDCSSDADLQRRLLRVSPNGVTAPTPANGGAFEPLNTYAWNGNGVTYDGGRPANPGNDTRRSPGPGDGIGMPMPAYAFVACIEKTR